jgi:putative SOS response-associated peptidase YedK
MCGRAICALDPENFLHLCKGNTYNHNKNKKNITKDEIEKDKNDNDKNKKNILNFLKYKKSYNICPERYLPGIYKSHTNENQNLKNFKEEQNKKDYNYNNKDFIINNFNKSKEFKFEDLEAKEKNENLKEAPQVEISEKENHKNNFVLDIMKWGTTNSKGYKVINARSETSDLFFKNLKKCVLIVQGFYEWKTFKKESEFVSKFGSESGKEIKKPYFFKSSNPEKDYLFIAGKYKNKYFNDNEKHNHNDNYDDIKEFLILTQEASKKASEIHHRMPIILNEENIE